MADDEIVGRSVVLRTLLRTKFVLVATVRDGGVQIDSSRIMIKHTFKKYQNITIQLFAMRATLF